MMQQLCLNVTCHPTADICFMYINMLKTPCMPSLSLTHTHRDLQHIRTQMKQRYFKSKIDTMLGWLIKDLFQLPWQMKYYLGEPDLVYQHKVSMWMFDYMVPSIFQMNQVVPHSIHRKLTSDEIYYLEMRWVEKITKKDRNVFSTSKFKGEPNLCNSSRTQSHKSSMHNLFSPFTTNMTLNILQ